jgi:cell division protein ZapA (FtsZ GTPase activity inhibitor)
MTERTRMTPKHTDPDSGNKAEKTESSPVPAAEVYSTKVTVCGETVQLRTDQPPEVVQRLAAYINLKVKQAGGAPGLAAENLRVLALASIGVAGELFEVHAKLEEHEKTHRGMLAKAKSLSESLDRALARP